MLFNRDNDTNNTLRSAYNAKQRLQAILGNERIITKECFDDLRKEIALSIEKHTRCSTYTINMQADRNNRLDIVITDVNLNLD
ncbi:cell division topological specificity factor MinE [Helicobacter sp. MIT 14-3879]|uniref:cell division topological specificity factor MinE n=1 Tax=Helicobacter sp. MIT 14-3879 TaxID=2040649 RepID=UPI000E1F7648|nr:cell division topological specificity factor MinE [Helicobacter sp. MIT 14-3879]RDU61362.1 hypothetical protein CQA44_09180 [Helicobacter sp. MIT 14-3879]